MASIKIYSTPERLYRYRPLTPAVVDRELKAVVDGFIWCPPFSSMNDPMEGVHQESLSSLVKGTKAEQEKVKREKAKLGIASLSEVNDHEPMWAHYASQFRGMCVSYRTARLLKSLPDEFDLVRMAYNERPPTLYADRSGAIDKAKLTLSTKTVRWASEREWRLITPGQGAAIYRDISCVERIYLGSRIEPDAERAVKSAVAHLNIDVFKMMINRYQVSFSKERA